MTKTVKNTPEQQAVLDVVDQNIIVSAQAGAGKTRVLVQRILQYIIRDRVGLDRMLIVTFTKKAANEMKDRIREKLMEALSEEGADRLWIYTQLNNVASANIQTMHAFCLEVLQEHFELIGRDPSFHIINDRKLDRLKDRAMDAVLEEVYLSDNPQVRDFAEVYGFVARRDDQVFRRLIEGLYEISNKQVHPQGWVDKQLAIMAEEEFSRKTFELWFADKLVGPLLEISGDLDDYEVFLHDPYIFEKLDTIIRSDLDLVQSVLFGPALELGVAELRGGGSLKAEAVLARRQDLLDHWRNLPEGVDFVGLRGISKKTKSPEELELKDRVKESRDRIKDRVKQFIEDARGLNEEDFFFENRRMAEDLTLLASFSKSFAHHYGRLKEEENGIDFNDVEHDMIRLLENESVRDLLRDRYCYIFFDEYQDASEVQNHIIGRISRETNLFFVGDIKQSIYGFRLAEPKNFLDRYDQYLRERKSRALDLTANFRSLPAILNFVNFVFCPLMTAERTGIAFDSATHRSNAKLGDEDKRGLVSLVLLEEEKVEEEEEQPVRSSLDDISSQAFYLAHKIKEKVGEGANYSDFAILFRTKHRIFQYERILEEFHIPYYSDSKTVEMDSTEVLVFIQLLTLIDNGQIDLALLSSLSSIVGNFSDEELARIRAFSPDSSFFLAMKIYQEGETGGGNLENSTVGPAVDPALQEKIGYFLDRVKGWRKDLKKMRLSDFVWKLLLDSGIYFFASSMPDGENRRENLNTILRLAGEYEADMDSSLLGFLHYLEGRADGGADATPASDLSEQDNVVRLMTIHKSKGLEFPVVFIVEMQKKFNRSSSALPLTYHKELGLALQKRYWDESLGLTVKGETRRQVLIKDRIIADDLAEEMRVLYVGMTRAERELYLLGEAGNLNEYLVKGRNSDLIRDLDSGGSYQDWLVSILSHDRVLQKVLTAGSDLEPELPTATKDFYGLSDGKPLPQLLVLLDKGAAYRTLSGARRIDKANQRVLLSDGLEEIVDFRYPYLDQTRLALKNTVSRISKKNLAHDGYFKDWPELEKVERVIREERSGPLFLQDRRRISPAEWGSLMHFALQLLPLKEYDGSSLTAELDSLSDRLAFTDEERAALDEGLLLGFFQSDLGREVIAHRDSVRREVAFTMILNPGHEDVSVDGQIDLFYEKEGRLHIVDFKTDRQADPNKYKLQMELYRQGLAKAYPDKPPASASLYWIRHRRADRFYFD